jgi:hypothetical protein
MMLNHFSRHVPALGLAYALTGIVFGAWYFRADKNRILRALCGVILAVAALNVYVEECGDYRRSQFENITFLLIIALFWQYGSLCVRLMEKAGIANRSSAISSSFLSIFGVCLVGLALASRGLMPLENPPLAVFLFIDLCCFIHVPAFAFGKSQATRSMAGRNARDEVDAEPRPNLLRKATIALAAPLLVVFALQVSSSNEWRLFSADAGMTLALASLILVSVRGERAAI